MSSESGHTESGVPVELGQLPRLQWLVQVYSGDAAAVTDAVADPNIFDPTYKFGLDTFTETYRPLKKLREEFGDITFTLGDVRAVAADLTHADLVYDGEVRFVAVVRFESVAPHRIMYWNSHPPVPTDVLMRPYQAGDAAGCVALERVCPMLMTDGSEWTIDRGEFFDDYLRLMEDADAWVAIHEDKVVGFYSCALRSIQFRGEPSYCIYQHHYRVHPDYRRGSIADALVTYVDPRRYFERYAAQFPYTMIDPNNVRMQNKGMFPAVADVTFARLAVALEGLDSVREAEVVAPSAETICRLINQTHNTRNFFQTYDADSLALRCERVPSYNRGSFKRLGDAVLGIWDVNEVNVLRAEGRTQEFKLSFVLDYGFTAVADLLELVRAVAPQLRARGTTHLCFLCDTRVAEYVALAGLAGDVQRFGVHTLPWIGEDFSQGPVYCDAIYL